MIEFTGTPEYSLMPPRTGTAIFLALLTDYQICNTVVPAQLPLLKSGMYPDGGKFNKRRVNTLRKLHMSDIQIRTMSKCNNEKQEGFDREEKFDSLLSVLL
jgi:formyltetrahydrofolate synthetase